jgi:hypothetical protein
MKGHEDGGIFLQMAWGDPGRIQGADRANP